MMNDFVVKILSSWSNTTGNVNSTEEILSWLNYLNSTTHVAVQECKLSDGDYWFYDDRGGEVLNRKRSYFSITGMRYFVDGNFVDEQPIIMQPEIGYLGIVCSEISGTLNFLMQAKVEPGNVNQVQLSPTLQATKSNFMRAHGGNLPAFFELFDHADPKKIIYDQVQSEQASRFYRKRNRNILLYVSDKLELPPNFKWMTLGQIKELMNVPNLVNMDTRTVLSCLPLGTNLRGSTEKRGVQRFFTDRAFACSVLDEPQNIVELRHALNDYKMRHNATQDTIPLGHLAEWKVDDYGITCCQKASFCIRYYDVDIEGREVHHWLQPLFKANGKAVFGLMTRVKAGTRQYLVRVSPEMGSFDQAEFGPSIQWECTHRTEDDDEVGKYFRKHISIRGGADTRGVSLRRRWQVLS